ncbi:hypothetical protein [Nostoc sp. UHCC 0870]|uniref:hypothetical protein n=1 Tax=Nostoc sp. UHCC 0870 TaxID=2914041 RepID=UPI001EDD05E7|nr:hypothetical protein [Nostoc sp. UHCC 0870]UKP01606.1 hypothetical protein L6494_30740 [Nostoc sp. UHCC 0870]
MDSHTEAIKIIESIAPKFDQKWDAAYKSELHYNIQKVIGLLTMPYQSEQTRIIKSQVRSLSELLESAEDILSEIVKHPHYLRLLDEGYSADLNVADAQSAIAYLQDELIS